MRCQNVHECLINNERDNNNKYELINIEWINIKYNNENTYENDNGHKFDNNLEEYILNGIMFIGMAGTGKSEILKETQRILNNSN